MRYCAFALLLTISPALRATEKISPAEREELKSRAYALWTAWDSFDPSRVAEFYSKDPGNVYYDISPLKFTGWQQYAETAGKNLVGAHAKWSPNGDDFKAIKSGNLAVITMTMNLAFTNKAGATTQMQVRVTDVWDRQDGKWFVVHEHASVPSR